MKFFNRLPRMIFTTAFAAFLITSAVVFFNGCERKEKVIDVETPAGDVEVERSPDTGEVDVDVNRE